MKVWVDLGSEETVHAREGLTNMRRGKRGRGRRRRD